MEHGRSERTLGLRSPHLRGGANGTIRGGERIGEEVGKKTSKQPLARRNGDGVGGGRRPGDSDRPEGDSDHPIVAEVPTRAAGIDQVPSEAGRVAEGTEAVAKKYTPPGCPMCQAVRPKGTNYTDVYCVRKDNCYTVRYCRCRFCANTFKDATKIN